MLLKFVPDSCFRADPLVVAEVSWVEPRRPISRMSVRAICPTAANSRGLVAWSTQDGFPGQPVLCPTLLPVGHDAAFGCLPQHPAAGGLNLGCNVFAGEERVASSCVRQWDRKQWRARLVQVAGKRTAVNVESPGEDRHRHIAVREALDVNELRFSLTLGMSFVATCGLAASSRLPFGRPTSPLVSRRSADQRGSVGFERRETPAEGRECQIKIH
jgi:hypothetical protein